MKRRSFLQSVIGGVTALFAADAWPSVIPETDDVDDIINETLANDPNWRDTQQAKPQQLGQRRPGYRPLARLDCGEAECIHYRWLGCHGCDDPANQSACALPLEKGYECLMSEDHIRFEGKHEDIEAASAYNEEISPPQGQAIPHTKKILDVCRCGDNCYVLVEGGELWMTHGGWMKYLPSEPVWQRVHQYPWMVDRIEAQTPSWIVGSGNIKGEKINFGGYLIKA